MAKVIKINQETKGASLKLIKPNPDVLNGLVIGFLESVVVVDVEAKKEDGDWADFIGKKVPRLEFNFVEVPQEKGAQAGVYRYAITPVRHVPNSDKYDWWFDQKPRMIKHFIDAFIGEVNFRKEYEKLLTLELSEEEMEAQKVLDAYRKFFEGVATVFNGTEDGKLPCIYKSADKQAKKIWMKLLLYVKGSPVNNGNYGFPQYPGDGVIELFEKDKVPSIEIKIAKQESIIPNAANSNVPKGTTQIPGGTGAPAGAPAGGSLPSWMQGAKS